MGLGETGEGRVTGPRIEPQGGMVDLGLSGAHEGGPRGPYVSFLFLGVKNGQSHTLSAG